MSGALDPHTAQYWDARAIQFGDDAAAMVGWHGMDYDRQKQYIHDLLQGLTLPGRRILDVGCGFGRFAKTIEDAEGVWHGLDFSLQMLLIFSTLRPHHGLDPQERFHFGDAHNPPESLGGFSLIFCIGGWKTCGFKSPDHFCDVYAPFIERPGHILLVECNEQLVRNYW